MDITILQDLFYGMIQSKSKPNPRTNGILTDTDLVINLTAPIKNEDGAVPTKAFTMTIVDFLTGAPEEIFVDTGELDVTGQIITLSNLDQRGIDPAGVNGIDFHSGDATRRVGHGDGSEVRVSISALNFQMMIYAMMGSIASGGTEWIIGKGTDVNIRVSVRNGDANEPFWEYNATQGGTGGWVFSNDGVSSTPFGTGAGVTGGDGITVTAGDIDIDLTDTVIFKSTSAGAGDSGKVARLNGSGKFDETFLQMLTSEATTLTDGSDATALHTHTIASQAEAEAGTENTKFLTSLRGLQAIQASHAEALVTPLDTTANVDNDIVINVGFAIGKIKLYIWLDGDDAAGSPEEFSWQAVYDSSGTLLFSQQFVGSAPGSGLDTRDPFVGASTGSGNKITVSIPTVAGTTFTIRRKTEGGGGQKRARIGYETCK